MIGDAAASSDPSYGVGQCLTVKDTRVLRDYLLDSDNWDEAGHAYAADHDRYFEIIHALTGWIYQLFYRVGPEADQMRRRALPLHAQDGSRMPDVLVSGPDLPLDEQAKRRFFGID